MASHIVRSDLHGQTSSNFGDAGALLTSIFLRDMINGVLTDLQYNYHTSFRLLYKVATPVSPISGYFSPSFIV